MMCPLHLKVDSLSFELCVLDLPEDSLEEKSFQGTEHGAGHFGGSLFWRDKGLAGEG